MRHALIISLIAAGFGCDEDVPFVAGQSATPPGKPPRAEDEELTPPPEPTLIFDAAMALGDADCFSVVELPEAQLVLAVSGEHRSIELLTIRDRQVTRELVGDLANAPARVPSCALSLDAKGRPEIVTALVSGETRATIHLRRDGARWVTSTIADFAAWQIAFSAKSPRGSEVMLIDAATRQHHALLVAGQWRDRPLPAPALADPNGRALAVAIDEDGRSHFALGSDYYGDRGDGYAFWPGDRPRDTAMTGAVAIVIDPADHARLPQIVYARRDIGADERASEIYRAVIGPDSSESFVWDDGLSVVGYEQRLAPYSGQIAARLDADGYLHTVSAVMHQRSSGTTWSTRYLHDRPRAPRSHEITEVRATGAVAFAAADAVIVSDHGRIRFVTRSSSFPAAEPPEILAPPWVGAVDACGDGPIAGAGATVLRTMPQLSAVALASVPSAAPDGGEAGDAIQALEWSYDRMSVRHTTGDVVGWTTSDVAP
jgi:hypothetical protein